MPKEKSSTRVRKHYDRNQIFYNLFWMNKRNLGMHYGFWEKGTKTLHQAILNENKAVAEELKIKKSDIVLDAGCGVGGTAIWLAENYGVKVVGITISRKQIGLARKNAKKRGVNKLVKFAVKDFCHTGLPPRSFDKILGIESVCHAEKKENFIKEAFRLLKPTGILVVADFFRKDKLTKEEERLLKEWCYGWEMPNLATLTEFRQKLKKADFVNIKCIDKTKAIEPSSRRMYIVFGKIVRTGLKILETLKLHASHGGTQATISQYHLFKKRATTYNIFSTEKS